MAHAAVGALGMGNRTILLLLATTIVGGGCSQRPGEGSKAAPPARAAYAVQELPDVEFNLPDLDGGRVRIPTPVGWSSGSKQNDRVVWFYHRDRSGLPRIIITASQPEEDAVETSSSNLQQFVSTIQARVEQEQDLVEPAKGMQLGDSAWVRYVMLGRTKEGRGVDRQFLKAVRAGREYTIELQVLEGTIHQFKTVAYAIAAHLSAVDAKSDVEPVSPPVEPAGDLR
jgi:hypothetical protein